MSAIRITGVPAGFDPKHIRFDWIGVELPLVTEEKFNECPPSDFKIGHDRRYAHLVLRGKAVSALRAAGQVEAAGYWESVFGR